MLNVYKIPGLTKAENYRQLLLAPPLANKFNFAPLTPPKGRLSRGQLLAAPPLTALQQIHFADLSVLIKTPSPDTIKHTVVLEANDVLSLQHRVFCRFDQVIGRDCTPEAVERLNKPFKLNGRDIDAVDQNGGKTKVYFLYDPESAPFHDDSLDLVDFNGNLYRTPFDAVAGLFSRPQEPVWLTRLKPLQDFWQPGRIQHLKPERMSPFTSPFLAAAFQQLAALAPSDDEGIVGILDNPTSRGHAYNLLQETSTSLSELRKKIVGIIRLVDKYESLDLKRRGVRTSTVAYRFFKVFGHFFKDLFPYYEMVLFAGMEKHRQDPVETKLYTLPMAENDLSALLGLIKTDPEKGHFIPDPEEILPATVFTIREIWPFMSDLILMSDQMLGFAEFLKMKARQGFGGK